MGHKVPMDEKEESRIVAMLGLVKAGDMTIRAISTRTGRSPSQIDKIRKRHNIDLGDLSDTRALSVSYWGRGRGKDKRTSASNGN